MDYLNSSNDNCVTSIEDTISISTVSDNLSDTFLIRDVPLPEPYSLAPPNRFSFSSNISDHSIGINDYFIHHQPTSASDKESNLERTKTMVTKDRIEEITDKAIGIIKDSRSKLTRLITDVTVLFPFLKEKVVLSQDDCDRICLQQLSSLKTDAFIDIVITRGPKGLAYFYEALKEHYNHVYLTLKHIFELKGIEIDAILNNKVKQVGRVSRYFRSIEEILGPEFIREKDDAKSILDSISALQMDNFSNQEIQELKLKYLELQKHYEPIQDMLESVSKDLMVKYNTFLIENECLSYENKAALITIDKLLEENRTYYEKVHSQNLKIELLQEEIDRCTNISDEKEQNLVNYKKIMEIKPSDEKFELLKFQNELQGERNRNAELSEMVEAIRIQKNDIFSENQQNLKENADLKIQITTLEQSKKKNYDDSTLKATDKHLNKFEEVKNTLSRTKQAIDGALSKICVKNSTNKEVNVKNTLLISDKVKDHLSQSLEIGVYFSEFLDSSLVKSIQPGDRLLKINNIKLAQIASTKIAKFMIQQAENTLKLMIARGSTSLDLPHEEHSYTLVDDDVYNLSRCASPSAILDSNRLTPVPSLCTNCNSSMMNYSRRISRETQVTNYMQPGIIHSCLNRSNDHLDNLATDLVIDIPIKNLLPYDANMANSCPQTPLSNINYNFPKSQQAKLDLLSVVTSDSSSDYSQDSDFTVHTKPSLQRPNSLPKEKKKFTEDTRFHAQFETVASPNNHRNFDIDAFDSVSELFDNGRTGTGLTGMVICTRRNPTTRMSSSNDDMPHLGRDQIRSFLPNHLFLRHAKISGGFGNPFFLHSSEELNQYKLKSGQKIYQINDVSTEYLTYEMFMNQCHLSSNITLYVSNKSSPHFKPEELSMRDHFYVIPEFTTKHLTRKGELYVSPSCVYLVTNTLENNDNLSRGNRFWDVTRIDPRNCESVENGILPSDMWLTHMVGSEDDSLMVSVDSQTFQTSQRPHSLTSSSVSEYDIPLEKLDFYYTMEPVKEGLSPEGSKSPFKFFTLVIRQDLPPQPVILFGYKWEDISEKLTTYNSTRESRNGMKFQLVIPTVADNVDYAKHAELEERHRNGEIIFYKGTDGRTRVVNVKTVNECAECNNIPVILSPFALIATAPALFKLNPIVIKLKFKYSSNLNKTDLPPDQRFHFDDMLRIGLSEDKYIKKLVNMVEKNRMLYEWKGVIIEN